MSKKKRRLKTKNILKLFVVLFLIIFIITKIFSARAFKVNLITDVYYIGEEFKPDFTATFKGKKVKKSDVKVDNSTYNNEIGTYEINFMYISNSKEYKVSKKIEIKDKEAPTITLKNGENIMLVVGNEYKEYGYEAYDSYDGDLTDKVTTTGTVDAKKEGTYVIKYQVSDSSGNKKMVKRTVTVTNKSPLTMSVKEYSLNGFFNDTILKENKTEDSSYVQNTIFAGDSTALYYVMNGVITGKQLWHKEGLPIDKVFTQEIYINHQESHMTLIKAMEQKKPERVLLMLGTNSVSTMELDYFTEQYDQLLTDLKKASPNTVLIVQSILPVTIDYDTSGKKLNNDKINKMNYKLLELCAKHNIPFLNTQEVLKDSEGGLKKEYARNESQTPGVHLTKEGNNVAIEYFKNHAIEK